MPSVDFAIQRVALRVKQGGHNILETDIRRRYERGLRLFNETYRPIMDAWYHWAASEEGLTLVTKSETT